MHRSPALVLTFLLVPFAASGQTVDTTRADVLRQLHGAYVSTTSYVDHLLIASKLARNGDMTYWTWVRKEAEKAIRHGQEAPRFRFWIHFGRRKPYDPNRTTEVIASEPRAGQSTYKADIDVNAENEPHENDLDMWRIYALANGASVTDKVLLRKALASNQGLVACVAALGLARIHDVKSIDDIKAAAQRHSDELPVFLEALVYLQDERGKQIAIQLSRGDSGFIQSLQLIAEANHFDPFSVLDERW